MKLVFPVKTAKSIFGLLGACAISLAGCVQVKTDPIKIEPIYIEITVNHKVQKELDDVFADIDAASETADFGSGDAQGN